MIIITKINDKYIFSNSYGAEVKISYIDKNGYLKPLLKTIIEFRKPIHSASISPQKNKIYACLTKSRNVVIFNFDLENKLMEQNKVEIFDEGADWFNKCIEIKDDHVVTADSKCIIIWEKSNDTYIRKKILHLNIETNDLLLINDEFFVSSQTYEKTITFIDISNLEEDRIITNVDSKIMIIVYLYL